MKYLIIGGVAAGTKAAAKLKRENRASEVKILTKSQDISYAGCGLPYYVGGLIESREELIVNTPQKYSKLTGAEVVTGCEVTAVDFSSKTVQAVKNGEKIAESYDKLIIATGAAPFVPDAVCTLSGGERQLAFLAMTLFTDAEIILLDEPTAGLDTEYRQKVYALIKRLKEYGKTVIVTIHNLDEAMTIADCVTVIDEGKIVFSADKDAFLASDVPERVFSLRPTRLFDEKGEEVTVFRPL